MSARAPLVFSFAVALAIGVGLLTPTPVAALTCCCTPGNACGKISVDSTGRLFCPANSSRQDFADAPGLTCTNANTVLRQQRLEASLKPGWVTAIIGQELVPASCRVGPQARPSDCNLAHVLQVVVNVTRLILGVVGSLALVMFIYGGFTLLLSAGNANRVDQARQTLINATVGLGVIFLSWTIVNFLLTLLTGSQNYGGGANVFDGPWNAGPPPSVTP